MAMVWRSSSVVLVLESELVVVLIDRLMEMENGEGEELLGRVELLDNGWGMVTLVMGDLISRKVMDQIQMI